MSESLDVEVVAMGYRYRDALVEEGRRLERAAIVAWLRRASDRLEPCAPALLLSDMADALSQAAPGEYPS